MQDLLLKLDRFWYVKVHSIHNSEYWWYACVGRNAHAPEWYQYDAVATEGRCSMGEGEIHEWNEASESFISIAKIKQVHRTMSPTRL